MTTSPTTIATIESQCCEFCHSTQHHVIRCTSPRVDEYVSQYNAEIAAILEENIYLSPQYCLTVDIACELGSLGIHGSCSANKVQRVMNLLLYEKPLIELKMLYLRLFPDTLDTTMVSWNSKYELMANIALKTCFERDSPFKSEREEDEDIYRLNMHYEYYLLSAKMKHPKERNDERLKMSAYYIDESLKRIRNKHLQGIMREYEVSTEQEKQGFLQNGIHAIHEGPVAIQSFFGNLTMSEISGWPAFRFAHVGFRMTQNQYVELHMTRTEYIHIQNFQTQGSNTPLHRRRRSPLLEEIAYRYKADFESAEDCAICYQTKCNMYLNCKHEFCMACIETYLGNCEMGNKPLSCPICRGNVTTITKNI